MTPTPAYRVLARKYRPSTFEDLIGQEAMVRTLKNAFASGRIAQAYMLTGVRGVGKTTTARILARALNYSGPGVDGPTIDMPGPGEHCQAIMESRHVDVTEMDAASHTGIGDIRTIIDSVMYRPVQARYKVYIIDEVHMLSTQAFNGLLKTLEEPPEHVKFIFATTEIRKVPITILSRCQRFDLRRIESDVMVRHLETICERETVEAEAEALALIARAGEGSARDSLSLLDQAIAHGSGRVEAEAVRSMLGLADRARILDLFESVMRGKPAEALAELRTQYDFGADPAVVLTDLADTVHFVTRIKVAPDSLRDPGLSEMERSRGRAFAEGVGLRSLNRAWQILLKGITETQTSLRPLAAAEMVLIRLCYAADLPTPDEALRRLVGGGGGAGAAASAPEPRRFAPQPPAAPAPAPPQSGARPADPDLAALVAPEPEAKRKSARERPETFEDLIKLAGQHDRLFMSTLETQVRLIRFEPPEIAIGLVEGAPATLGPDLARRLQTWTGERWQVSVERKGGAPTVREARAAEQTRLRDEARTHPTVASVLQNFPGAEIVTIRNVEAAPEPVESEDPGFMLDPEPVEDD